MEDDLETDGKYDIILAMGLVQVMGRAKGDVIVCPCQPLTCLNIDNVTVFSSQLALTVSQTNILLNSARNEKFREILY